MDIKIYERQAELWELTLTWIKEHPEMYGRFVELALSKVEANQEFGVNSLVERAFWDYSEWAASKGLTETEPARVPVEFRRYIALHMYETYPHIEQYCSTKKAIQMPPALLGKVRSAPQDVVDDPSISTFLYLPFVETPDLDELFATL